MGVGGRRCKLVARRVLNENPNTMVCMCVCGCVCVCVGGVGPASPLRLAQILLQLEVLAVEILELAPRDADLGVAVLGAVGFLCIARGERAGLRENTMELESLSPDTVIHLELHGGH